MWDWACTQACVFDFTNIYGEYLRRTLICSGGTPNEWSGVGRYVGSGKHPLPTWEMIVVDI